MKTDQKSPKSKTKIILTENQIKKLITNLIKPVKE